MALESDEVPKLLESETRADAYWSVIGVLTESIINRSLAGLSIAAVAVVVLSGCTAQDEIGARLSADGSVEFAVCETLEINRIEVRKERESDSEPIENLWVATGSYSLSNLHLTYGEPPAGMTNEVDPVAELPASFVFYAEEDDEDGRVLDVVQATFATSELSASHWIMTDGRTLDEAPC